MTNLMLTTACNFHCEYCFGRDLFPPGHQPHYMSWEMFIDILDWVERGDTPGMDIHLMGGEPTLHPRFLEMIREIRNRNRVIFIFSNASVPLKQDVLQECVRLDTNWVVNTNDPSTYRPKQLEILRRNLKIIGKQAMLTLNITKRDTPFSYIFEYIDKFDLGRRIKIGVALPTLNKSNVYVGDGSFSEIGDRIMEIKEKADADQVDIEFECGVPYCIFKENQLKKWEGTAISHCGSRLDITPDGHVINCLPLCTVASVPYTVFGHYSEAVGWFRRLTEPYRSLGKDNACLSCAPLREGLCSVCLAHGMNGYSHVSLPSLPGKSAQAE